MSEDETQRDDASEAAAFGSADEGRPEVDPTASAPTAPTPSGPRRTPAFRALFSGLPNSLSSIEVAVARPFGKPFARVPKGPARIDGSTIDDATIDGSPTRADASPAPAPPAGGREMPFVSPRAPAPHVSAPHVSAPHVSAPHVPAPHVPSPHVPSPHVPSPHVLAPHVPSPHVSAIPAIMARVAAVEAAIPHGRTLPHYDEAMAALFGDACWTDHLRRSGTAAVAMRDGAVLHDLVPRLWRPRPVLRGGELVGLVHAAPDRPRPPDPAAVARLVALGLLEPGAVTWREPGTRPADHEAVAWAPLRWCGSHDDRDARRATGWYKAGMASDDPRVVPPPPKELSDIERMMGKRPLDLEAFREKAERLLAQRGLGDAPNAPWYGNATDEALWHDAGGHSRAELPWARRFLVRGAPPTEALDAKDFAARTFGPWLDLAMDRPRMSAKWEWDALLAADEAAHVLGDRMTPDELASAMARVVAGLRPDLGLGALGFPFGPAPGSEPLGPLSLGHVAERWWRGSHDMPPRDLAGEVPDAWSLWRPDPRQAALVAWRSAWGEVGAHVPGGLYGPDGRMPGRAPRPTDGRERPGPFMGDDRHPDALSAMMAMAHRAWELASAAAQGGPAVHRELGLVARGPAAGSPVDPDRVGAEAFVAAVETIAALTGTARALDHAAGSTERARGRVHAASRLAIAASVARARLAAPPRYESTRHEALGRGILGWHGADGLPDPARLPGGRRSDGLALYAPAAFDPRAARDAAWRDHPFALRAGYGRAELAEGWEWARWTAFGAVAVAAGRAGVAPMEGAAGREMADWMAGIDDPLGRDGHVGGHASPLDPLPGHVADVRRARARGGGDAPAAVTLVRRGYVVLEPHGDEGGGDEGGGAGARTLVRIDQGVRTPRDGDVPIPLSLLATTGERSRPASCWGFVPVVDGGTEVLAGATGVDEPPSAGALARSPSRALVPLAPEAPGAISDGVDHATLEPAPWLPPVRRVAAVMARGVPFDDGSVAGDGSRVLGPPPAGVRLAFPGERLDAFGRREGHGAAMLRERRRRLASDDPALRDPASALVDAALRFLAVGAGGEDLRPFVRPVVEDGPLDRLARTRGRAAATLHAGERAGSTVRSEVAFVRNFGYPDVPVRGAPLAEDDVLRMLPQSEVAPHRVLDAARTRFEPPPEPGSPPDLAPEAANETDKGGDFDELVDLGVKEPEPGKPKVSKSEGDEVEGEEAEGEGTAPEAPAVDSGVDDAKWTEIDPSRPVDA